MPSDARYANQVPGPVIKIRLATEDVMRAIDAAERAGLAEPGMSLAQVCKWGIVKALYELERAGMVPARPGYEYSTMIKAYESIGSRRKALVAQQVLKHEIATRGRVVPRADDLEGVAVARLAADIAERRPDLAALAAAGNADTPARSDPLDPHGDLEEDDSHFRRRPRSVRIGPVRMAELDQRVMSPALASERVNLTPSDRAEWLLNSISAQSWATYFTIDDYNDAAAVVLEAWPAGAAELREFREKYAGGASSAPSA